LPSSIATVEAMPPLARGLAASEDSPATSNSRSS
jgi:hypothetical protein